MASKKFLLLIYQNFEDQLSSSSVCFNLRGAIIAKIIASNPGINVFHISKA